MQETEPERQREVMDRHERKNAETPERECVRKSGQRALPDHESLQQHFPHEPAEAR